jgi:predicted DsbA family dithiol-disulfide isomerase
MSDNSISIDVVSDVVCPWCFLGEKRLRAAIAAVGDVDVTVRWRPFQLDPTIPPQGKDRKEYMRAKFGDGDRLHQIHANLVSLGAADGISFDFDAIRVSPNTLDAHRVIRWAGTMGEAEQNRLVEDLFSRYFERGENTGDAGVLIEAAKAAGMDTAVVETLLPTDADADAVRAEIKTAARMGITGVPCFLLEGKYAVMGAQETGVLADAIRQISAAKARGELDAPA